MAKITYTQLKANGTCSSGLSQFKKLYPLGFVEVTEKEALQVAQVANWDWLASKLLKAPAWKAYIEAKAPAWEAYDEARALASKAYDEARAPAFINLYNQQENSNVC